jgi:FMN phosphatase YigB (HAD superfamily)
MDGTLYHKMHEDRAAVEMAERIYAYAEMLGLPEEGISKLVNKDVKYLRISSLVYNLSRKYGLYPRHFVDYVYDVHPVAFGIRRDRRLASLLRRAGRTRTIVLFTNSPMIWVDRVLGKLGISRIISRKNIISFENLSEGKHAKPSVGAFRILLKRTGNDPKNLLLLEDTYGNIRTAKRLGIRTVRVFNKHGKKRNEKDIYEVLSGLLPPNKRRSA